MPFGTEVLFYDYFKDFTDGASYRILPTDSKFPLPIESLTKNLYPKSLQSSSINMPVSAPNLSAGIVGGFTSIGGALAAIAGINASAGLPSSASYRYPRCPRTKWCFGDSISESIWVSVGVLAGYFDSVGSINISRARNFRARRYYIHHGEVERVYREGDAFYIDAGIDGSVSSGIEAGETSIVFTRSDGTPPIRSQVVGLKENWDFKLELDENNLPQPGDFWRISQIWVKEDPYLLAGRFRGDDTDTSTENERAISSAVYVQGESSGKYLPLTDDQVSYVTGFAVGAYAFKSRGNTVEGDSEDNTETIIQGAVGASMQDSADYTWAWIPLYQGDAGAENEESGSFNVEVYGGNPNRYVIVERLLGVLTDPIAEEEPPTDEDEEEDPSPPAGPTDPAGGEADEADDETGGDGEEAANSPGSNNSDINISEIPQERLDAAAEIAFAGYNLSESVHRRTYDFNQKIYETRFFRRVEGTVSDLAASVDHVRIELQRSGYSWRHNFYAPMLKNQYLVQNGKYFKILAHIESHIVDVKVTSVDGSATFDLGTQYSIFNQNAWRIAEDFHRKLGSGTRSNNWGMYFGEVSNLSPSESENTTSLTLRTFQLDSDSMKTDFVVSMNDRYTKTYEPKGQLVNKYNKFDGYYFCSEVKFWPITSISFSDLPEEGKQFYTIDITVDGIIDEDDLLLDDVSENLSAGDIQIGTTGYIAFDEPYLFKTKNRNNIYEGIISEQTLALAGYTTLYMNGFVVSSPYDFNIPSGSRLGLQQGTWFGYGPIMASSSYSSRIAVRTVQTDLCLSGFYDSLNNEHWLFYSDPINNTLTIRKAHWAYSDLPSKTEIVIGYPVKAVAGSGSDEITLNTDFERLSRIYFKPSEGPTREAASASNPIEIQFGIGSVNNVHGNTIGGDGPVKLDAFTINKEVDKDGASIYTSDDFNYENFKVSPAYVYKTTSQQQADRISVPLGYPTDVGTIYLIGGTADNTTLEYFNNKQTIDNPLLFDAIRFPDGEKMVVYSREIPDFKVSGKEVLTGGWNSSKGVLLISNFEDSYRWLSPTQQSAKKTGEPNVGLPIMPLYDCDYLTSVYSPLGNQILFFATFYDENGQRYVGCYGINRLSLADNLIEATPNNENSLAFMFRPAKATLDVVSDPLKFFTDNVAATYEYKENSDSFSRIMGLEGTEANIILDEEVEKVSVANLRSGIIALSFSSQIGIRMAYSTNQNTSWVLSSTVFSIEGTSPHINAAKSLLFYITDSGIVEIELPQTLLENDALMATKKAGGEDVENLEREVQEAVDQSTTRLIGSGSIDDQKITSYVDEQGIIWIYYYQSDGSLSALYKNSGEWKPAPNF